MKVIICLLIIGCMIFSVVFRVIILHPFKTIYYGIKDPINYLKKHEKDKYNGGLLNCYFAHFGGGKTLSAVHYISFLYKRYNNKKVWDDSKKKLVTQKIHIISNVEFLKIPYEPLNSLSQVVECAMNNKKIDVENDLRTCTVVLIDEASAQMNSRNFKTNIDADFLNSLITCRHYNLSLYYTAQKFKLVDALLRQVTQQCIWCHKVWRVMVQHVYDADEMEYATNPTMVQPKCRKGFFITDKDFKSYDTHAVVDKLKHSVDTDDMRSEEEIIAMRGLLNPDNDAINHPSRKLRNRMKNRK